MEPWIHRGSRRHPPTTSSWTSRSGGREHGVPSGAAAGRHRRVDPPWGHVTAPFVSFHRPLSTYWKTFRATGFEGADFDEPRLTPDRYQDAISSRDLINCRTRPYSVAFRLRKPAP